jgi:hypothetical protein
MTPESRRFAHLRHFVLASLSGCFLIALAPGCANRATSICQKFCDCAAGCIDSELETCVENVETNIEEAERAGCSSENDDYLGCLDDQLDSCRAEPESACRDEANLILRCLGAAPADESSPSEN